VATPTPQTWLGSAFCIASAAMLAIAWFLLASACAMAVVRDTANGSDEVRDWPGAVFLDWFGEVFYLFNGLCVSVLPGAGLAWLLAGYDFSGLPAASIIAFLLFPIVLLSMLEQNSALGVISPSTWGTLRKDSGAWATFYLFSAVLLLAVGVVERVVFFLGGFLGSIVLALSLTVVWLIYFRLLGRLAWHCADRAAREEIEAELEEDEEIEEDDAETFSGGETWPAG